MCQTLVLGAVLLAVVALLVLLGSDSRYISSSLEIGVGEGSLEMFTVVIATYRRPDLYRRVVEHMCAMRHVDRVVLVWNNLEWEPPAPASFACVTPGQVVVLPMHETHEVQNRYLAAPLVRTDAVLNVDDECKIPESDVQRGFQIWKRHREQLVGYWARHHQWDDAAKRYRYLKSAGHDSAYSIVIGQSFWAHRKYYELYIGDDRVARQLRAWVSKAQCCDDLALNMLVAARSKLPPVLVRPFFVEKLKSDSEFQGKSAAPGWWDRRSDALTNISRDLFRGDMPLRYSTERYARPFPRFMAIAEWIYLEILCGYLWRGIKVD